MKFFKNRVYLFVMFFATLASCEQNINIDLPYSGDKIVVNAILGNDSILYARITKNAPTVKDVSAFEEITGAKAELYENGILKETLKERLYSGKKLYVSTLPVKSGFRYDVKVSANGLNSVTGSDEVPFKPFFVPVEFTKQMDNTVHVEYGKLKLKIKDPAGMKNYYRLRVYPASTKPPTIGIFYTPLEFKIDNFVDQGGAFGAFGDDFNRAGYFTDETFDGQEFTLNVTVDLNSHYTSVDFNDLAPELSQLSRSSYLYFDSKNKQEDNEENPFAEAVVVYSNIQNGFGIVGGLADSVAVIRRSN